MLKIQLSIVLPSNRVVLDSWYFAFGASDVGSNPALPIIMITI